MKTTKKDEASPSPIKGREKETLKLDARLIEINFIVINKVTATYRATKLFITNQFLK